MEPFLGELGIVAFNFAPRGWALCNGQILSISQNQALFSLLGTTYGGNGQTTFALPNLQSRLPIHAGQGVGLSNYNLGEVGGAEGVALTMAQLPAHAHSGQGVSGAGSSGGPAGQVWAGSVLGDSVYNTSVAPNATMSAAAIAPSGGAQPHDNRQPYLVLNFIIALVGVFPSRN